MVALTAVVVSCVVICMCVCVCMYFVNIGPFCFRVVCRVVVYPLFTLALVFFNKLRFEYLSVGHKREEVLLVCLRIISRAYFLHFIFWSAVLLLEERCPLFLALFVIDRNNLTSSGIKIKRSAFSTKLVPVHMPL
jgi:hypothetical protein